MWWLGLGKTKARTALKALQKEITTVGLSEVYGYFMMLNEDAVQLRTMATVPRPVVNLLPVLDPYLMGYKERERYIENAPYDWVFDRSGNATSTILAGGRVAGVWDFEEAEPPTIKLFFFQGISSKVQEAAYTEAQRMGAFLGGEAAQIRQCTTMTPLTKRTAGSFMSPLKDC